MAGHNGLLVLMVFSVFLNSPGWSPGVSGCPPDECICDRELTLIDCSDFGLTSMPHFEMENRTYSNLDLSLNRIKNVQADAFADLKVEIITIEKNHRKTTIQPEVVPWSG